MSDSMNSEYDAVFTKKSFDEIDNSDMKTLMVEKIEILTRLCYRMQEKMEIMEIRSRIMEKNQEKGPNGLHLGQRDNELKGGL